MTGSQNLKTLGQKPINYRKILLCKTHNPKKPNGRDDDSKISVMLY